MIEDRNHKEFRNVISSLSPFGEDAFAALSRIFSYAEFVKHRHFSHQGSPSDSIGFVVRGVFRAYFITEDGREYVKYFLAEGDAILANIEQGAESRASIQSLVRSTAVVARYDHFLECCRKYPDLETARLGLIASCMRKKEIREINLLSNDARTNYTLFRNEYPDIEKRIAQYQVARYLGITPTQMARLKNKKS